MAIFFIITSISLTIIHKKDKPTSSIIDKIEKIEEKNKTPQIPSAK
jgi:preprotein translocase subunit SecG